MASERVMKFSGFFVILIMAVALNNSVFAGFTTNGYASEQLYSTQGTFTVIEGLDLDESKLYFGQNTDIKSFDLLNQSTASVGTIENNYGIAHVTRNAGLTYTAYGVDGTKYPHRMGYIDATGTYNNQLNEDGIYDAAVSPNGNCYIVANPDALGSQILQYDWTTGDTTLIADIGGWSGGLTFDSAGNIYYADQGDGERTASIIKFTASQLSTGELDISDAESVLDIAAGFIGFDGDDNFYATTGWGANFSMYDLSTGSLLSDIASGSIGKFVFDGDDVYTIDTDWGNYYSTIQQITIPEPTTITLLSLAALWLRRRRV